MIIDGVKMPKTNQPLLDEIEKLERKNEKWFRVAKDFEMEAHDLWCKNNELQQRIDKAIEHIKATYNHCLRNIDWLNEDDLIEREEIIKLLNILRGNDK